MNITEHTTSTELSGSELAAELAIRDCYYKEEERRGSRSTRFSDESPLASLFARTLDSPDALSKDNENLLANLGRGFVRNIALNAFFRKLYLLPPC